MRRPLAVVRPAPGDAATAARIAAAGARAIRLPFFAVRPLDWTPPDPGGFDALLLTSANALRHGGAGLATYRALPVHAVGAATAAAARAAGFAVAATGEAGAMALLGGGGFARALHLAGRDRRVAAHPAIARSVPVYESAALPVAPADVARLAGSVVLLHSARAAGRLAELVADRGDWRIAALSGDVMAAAGDGWAAAAVAARPEDAALVAAALALAD